MSEPRTPQVPMVDGNGEPFYPLTQYNQIVMPDGSRWDGKGGGAQIDDTSASAEKVYSSQKVEAIANQLSEQIAAETAAREADVSELNQAIVPEQITCAVHSDEYYQLFNNSYAIRRLGRLVIVTAEVLCLQADETQRHTILSGLPNPIGGFTGFVSVLARNGNGPLRARVTSSDGLWVAGGEGNSSTNSAYIYDICIVYMCV